MRIVLTLTVVALICLAGCGSFTANSDTITTESTNVQTSSSISDYPKGLSDNGVTNEIELAQIHSDSLNNQSYTMKSNTYLSSKNRDEEATTNTTVHVNEHHNRTVTTQKRSGLASTSGYAHLFNHEVNNLRIWYDGEYTILAVGPNKTTTESFESHNNPDQELNQMFLQYYSTADSESVSTANGTIQVHLNSLSGNRTIGDVPVNITNGTIVVVMTNEGRVIKSHLDFTGVLINSPNTSVEGSETIRFTDVGKTAVNKPNWVTSAQNSTETST